MLIVPRCDEHQPTPLWRELLLAVVPVIAPVIVEKLLDALIARVRRDDEPREKEPVS